MNNMHINSFSFLSAVIWSSLFISVFYLLRRTLPKAYCLGLPWFVLLYFCSMLRGFFPFELPRVSVVENFSFYAVFCDWLLYKRIWIPVTMTWILVSCVFLCRYVRQYYSVLHNIRQYAVPWDAHTEQLLQDMQAQSNRSFYIDGYRIKNLHSPFGLGVFHKIIVLPDEAYSDEQLQYILLHEYTHFLHHDTLLKTLVEIFCILFWWNPVVYLLRRDLEQIVELRCDRSVSRRLSKQQRAEYLRTMLSALQHACAKKQTPYSTTAFSYRHADYDIKERFDAVMHDERKLSHIPMVVCTLLFFAALFRISYAFQLQPLYNTPPSTEANTIDLQPQHTIIQKGFDGTYRLYLDGEWFSDLTEQEFAAFQTTETPIADNTKIFQDIPSIYLEGESV